MDDVHPIAGDKDLIIWLQNKVTIWNGQFILSLDGTDNDIAIFLPKLEEAHLAKVAIGLDFKLHQGNATICKMLYRQGIGEINAICDIAGCQQFRIDN